MIKEVNNITLTVETLNRIKKQVLMDYDFKGNPLLTKYADNKNKLQQIFEYQFHSKTLIYDDEFNFKGDLGTVITYIKLTASDFSGLHFII